MKITVNKVAVALGALMVIACAGGMPYETDYDVVLAGEAQKVRTIQIGMTLAEVEKIMGTESMMLSNRMHTYANARPVRLDRYKAKDGSSITVYYYRTSGSGTKLASCPDDQTTAVIFIDGKVDSVMSGGSAKSVIEVRVR